MAFGRIRAKIDALEQTAGEARFPARSTVVGVHTTSSSDKKRAVNSSSPFDTLSRATGSSPWSGHPIAVQRALVVDEKQCCRSRGRGGSEKKKRTARARTALARHSAVAERWERWEIYDPLPSVPDRLPLLLPLSLRIDSPSPSL